MNANALPWLLVLEFTLPFLVLSIILIVMMSRGRKKYKEAARKLILKIKNNEQRQRDNIVGFLTEKLQFEEKKANKLAKKIINERKFLFRNLVSGLLEKNTAALASLEDDLSRIADQYHNLDINLTAPEPEPEVDEEEQQSIEELKQEVKTLKHEVHVTLTTLNNIFGEFSSMFGEEVPDKEMSVDQIITAMETFTNKSGGKSDDDFEEIEAVEEADAFAEMEATETEEVAVEEPEEDAFAELTESNDDGDFDAFAELEEGVPDVSADELPAVEEPNSAAPTEVPEDDDPMAFPDMDELESELDDIDSALDDLELGSSGDEEPSWEDAFNESGDEMSDGSG